MASTRQVTVRAAREPLRCPKCGAGEMHPNGKVLTVRGYKVYDASGYGWSQCLVCAGYYNPDLTEKVERVPDETGRLVPVGFDPEAGWF